jgi:hypothetical protein
MSMKNPGARQRCRGFVFHPALGKQEFTAMSITQLAFDFTYPLHHQPDRRQPASWRITTLSRRHRISANQAVVYAIEMRLPTEVR